MKRKLFVCTAFLVLSFLCLESAGQRQRNRRPQVEIQTSEGNILIELFNETPVHRDNFLKLIDESIYDSVLFHRTVRSFVIQAGDPESRNAAPGMRFGECNCGGAHLDYTLPAEIRPQFVHTKGALAAARLVSSQNEEKRSSSCQFYIVQGRVQTPQRMTQLNANRFPKYTDEQIQEYTTIGGVPHLDGARTVFGRVISGLDVVEKISLMTTDEYDRPLQDIRMWVKIIKK